MSDEEELTMFAVWFVVSENENQVSGNLERFPVVVTLVALLVVLLHEVETLLSL